MINLSSISEEQQSTGVSLSDWMAKLQEGKKSTRQLQTEMLTSSLDQIDKIQEKALEKAEEKHREEKDEQNQNEEAVNVSVSSVEVTASSDIPDTESATASVDVEA